MNDPERERERRAQYLSGVHAELPKKMARVVVAAEQGFTTSGIAKLPDVTVSENTVKRWFELITASFGDEAVYAKPTDERKGPLGPSETVRLHMPYEPDKMESEAEQSDDSTFSGTIETIEESTAGEVYGSEASEPGREVIIVHVTVETPTDDMKFNDTFSLPKGPQSWHNPNFKLGNFHDHYGELPREGQAVEVSYNDDGYLRIETSE